MSNIELISGGGVKFNGLKPEFEGGLFTYNGKAFYANSTFSICEFRNGCLYQVNDIDNTRTNESDIARENCFITRELYFNIETCDLFYLFGDNEFSSLKEAEDYPLSISKKDYLDSML